MNVEELNLISAAVDGELSEPEQKLFRRLCSDNTDAAALYRKLQANANRLNQLRRVKAPATVRTTVMARIQAHSTPKRSNNTRTRSFLPVSVAASILFTVVSASFWYFSAQERKSLAKTYRDQLPAIKTQLASGQSDRDAVTFAQSNSQQEPKTPNIPKIVPPVVPPERIVQVPPAPPELAPYPKPVQDVLGSPLDNSYRPVVSADLQFPLLLNAEELAHEDIQATLKKDLTRDPAYRMDLFARNMTQAMDAFVRTARSNGIKVIVDARTQELLNMKSPVTLIAYSDSLTANEIAQLLGELSKTMNAAGKPLPITSCHLISANLNDQKDIREVTGVDPSWFRPRNNPTTSDPKPISSETIGKITSAVKKPEKTMVLTAFGPAQSRIAPAMSREMKQFNDRPIDRKLPIMFVIRPQA